MNKYEIVKKIETFAPLSTQEKWDASGWIVDLESPEISKIMFALTITKQVVKQALEQNCDMIISHHPLFFVPLEYRKINMYCAHTNLDKANGGTTDLILEQLGFQGKVFEEFVRIVELPEAISVEELKEKLLPLSPKLRYINNNSTKTIQTIGFCAGSGSEFMNKTPCDAFVTGDLKFHTAAEAEKVVFDIGHFESEIMSAKLLKKITEVREKGVLANEKSPFI
ncbi:MAG: Nif3-like dinuclear metal center hexameric protein [Candidatus Gastranaerophilales bacterium]|nr:Nif3-like dinuclear metal center hexameric protein [Candidatus Gastranaerophilales bacterium]MCM1073082.1 Nif3-like dinuclear metal center hexameric protein [Bacteroides sp.]